jgi:uncharacterized membrane protein YfcA
VVLAAIPLGIAIGLAVGALGGGGSVLAVPVLVYVLGQSVHAATTTSLVVVIAGALAGSLGHQRDGCVCWRHAGIFSAAALPGVVAGTIAGNAVGGRSLIAAFAIVMLAAAVGTWRRAGDSAGDAGDGVGLCPPLRAARDVGAGLAVGLATGFFGVGGGFLVVPTLAITLAFTMRRAVATSLAIITITAAFGLAAHLAAGRGLDVELTFAMAGACALGAFGGAALARRLSPRRLGHGFALLVAGVAAYVLVSAAFLGGPPGSG